MKIAIIPAISVSKRILNKNVKNFYGKPIIYWTIKNLLKSKLFDRIIVSTDSLRIKKIVNKFNIETPFLRPKNISDDKTSIQKVIIHAIHWLKRNENIEPKYVCCVLPTAIFIDSKTIVNGYNKIKNKKWDFVFSSIRLDNNILRGFVKNADNSIKMLFANNYYKRTQDLTSCYVDAGQFYWGKLESWKNNSPIFSKKSTIVVFSKTTQDIDTIEDWNKAKKLWKQLYK
jgi:pseudaminic acid cytidylyltransferase